MKRMRYIGPDLRLRGATALIDLEASQHRSTDDRWAGMIGAQFDDMKFPESHSWHPFPLSQFEELVITEESFASTQNILTRHEERFNEYRAEIRTVRENNARLRKRYSDLINAVKREFALRGIPLDSKWDEGQCAE